jgi:hypothetical protein
MLHSTAASRSEKAGPMIGTGLSAAVRLHHRWHTKQRWNSRLRQCWSRRYEAGHSQRAIARELNIDRRKVRRILDQAA